jgi:predicted Zn-dependent peptidase
MFRRRFVVFRRPRLLGAVVVGGLGFAAGRASKGSSSGGAAASPATPQTSAPDLTAQLKELADLRASGALTDEEFAAAKSKLIGS